MSWNILEGDCIDVMRTLPAESVDALFTSPPYAMQRKATYGGVPEADYPAWTVAWMREARRLLKPDGSVVINLSPHIVNGQISDYVLRSRLALRGEWVELDEMVWHKPDAMPTGSPKRPRRAWESLLWYAKHPRPYSDPKANGKPLFRTSVGRSVQGGAAVANQWGHGIATRSKPLTGIARSTNVASIAKAHVKHERTFAHPAPFPSHVAEWVGKLICPTGGTILDPFSGSASTGVAAIRNGWNYIGIEAMPEYAHMSRRRLTAEEAKAA